MARRRPASLLAAVWLGGLVGVAAIGWMGSLWSPPPRPAEADRASPADPRPTRPGDSWLRLDRPARRDEVITTPTIVVRGEVGHDVSEVRLTLESRTGKLLAVRTIRPAPTNDASGSTFGGRFLVGTARPTGRVFVTATAIGPDGVPVGATRRRIEIGPVEPAALPRTRDLLVRGWVARTIGELRLMVASAALEPIAFAAIDPTGMPRNGMVPFEATFRLPRTAVSPGTDLLVVPVDGDGRPLPGAPTHQVDGALVELVIR